MGEMAANILMGGKFVGYSAGSKPTGSVNNAALDIAKEIRYPLSKLNQKASHHLCLAKIIVLITPSFEYDLGM